MGTAVKETWRNAGGGGDFQWTDIQSGEGGGVKPKPKNLLDQLDEKKITWANEN